jgi:D-alanyl-D-alanine carboxypeptidase (penicillin-binding protein 5/6)
MQYAGIPTANVVYASGHTNTWKNTNLLLQPDSLFYSPFVTGLKTGSGGQGNYSLISSVQYEEKSYIIGVFSSPDENTRFSDTLKIIKELCPAS